MFVIHCVCPPQLHRLELVIVFSFHCAVLCRVTRHRPRRCGIDHLRLCCGTQPQNSVFGRGFTRWSCSPGGVVHQVESILGKKTPQSSPRAETFTQLRNTWICDSQAAGHKQEHPHARGLTQFGTRIHLTHPSRHQMPQYRGGTGLTKCPKMSS